MKPISKTFDTVLKLSIVGLVLCSVLMGSGLSRINAKSHDLKNSLEEKQTVVDQQTQALHEFEANFASVDH